MEDTGDVARVTELLIRVQSGQARSVLDELGPLQAEIEERQERDQLQWIRMVRFAALFELQLFGRADQTAAEIINVAEPLDASAWVSLGRALRGSALQLQGKFEVAYDQLARAVATLEEPDELSYLRGHAINAAAVTLARLDLYELASSWLDRLYPLAVERGDTTLVTLYAFNSGWINLTWAFDLELNDDLGTAREHFRRTLDALEKVPNELSLTVGPVWSSEVVIERCVTRTMLGDSSDDVMEDITRQLKVVRERGRHDSALLGHLGLARAYAQRGDLDRAVGEAEKSCQVADLLPRFLALAGRAYWEYAALLRERDGASTATNAFAQLSRRLIHDRWIERRARVESFEIRLEQERAGDELRRRAAAYLSDTLTGLGNRRLVEIRLPEMLIAAAAQGSSVVVAFVDVDDFKSVNDELSHLAGDELLCELAQEMRGSVRSEDIIARFGGEEFVIVLPGRDSRQGYDEMEALRQRVERRTWTSMASDRGIRVTIGMVESWDGATRTQLLASADEALLSAKRAGKNRVEVRARP